MSANDHDIMKDAALAAGIDLFVAKPLTFKALVKAIQGSQLCTGSSVDRTKSAQVPEPLSKLPNVDGSPFDK